MTNKAPYITVGKIGATFGILGWLKIQSFTEYGPSILEYQPWYLSGETHQQTSPIQLEGARLQGSRIIAKIAGVNTPEAARLYTGKLITVPRAVLPALKKDEYYWRDLEGLNVIDQHGRWLGKVIYLLATGANDVLVVKGEIEQAIPFLLNQTVQSVDLDKQEIHVNWEPL